MKTTSSTTNLIAAIAIVSAVTAGFATGPAFGQTADADNAEAFKFRFTYDAANRLKSADHYSFTSGAWFYANRYSESGINYDLNGKPVEGWKPPRTPNTCDVPVQFLRLRGKDHLVLVDHGGKVTVLDRRGEPRYAAKLEAAGMDRALGLLPALDIGDVRLLWRDKDGGTHAGTLSGTVEPLPSAEDALNVNGALRYPLADIERPAPVEDIDMDGRRERVSIDDRGRITATDAP